MITGERPFRGKSAIDILHAITNQDPAPVAQLTSQLPPELADVLSKALAKETSERYQHAGDFELDLRRFKRALESNSLIRTQRQRPGILGSSKWSPSVPLLLVGAFIVFGVAAIINITNNGADDVQPAFSPDGKQIAFVSTRSSSSNLLYPGRDRPLLGGDIWVMPALGGSARRIVESGNFPSWSADGKTIIFTSGTSQFQSKLHRVDAQGGPQQDISVKFKADEPLAPFWLYPSYSSDMRWISFEADGNIFVVSSEGGEATRIVKGRRPTWGVNSQAIIYSNDEPGRIIRCGKYLFRRLKAKLLARLSRSRSVAGATRRRQFLVMEN